MKRIISLGMVFIMAFAITSCAKNEVKDNEPKSVNDTLAEESAEIEETEVLEEVMDEQETISNQPHTEYVTTYHIFAKKGAVIMDYDSITGSFTYMGKCEVCGETDGSVNNMGPTYGGSISASFVCKNPNCSMKGKSQPVEIGCETSGEWVEK